MTKPLLVAIEMGYGHLRAAIPLGDELGIEVLHADRPPTAGPREQSLWRWTRRYYEGWARLSTLPLVGEPLRWALNELTHIPPLYPRRDLSAPTTPVRLLSWLASRGLGAELVAELRRSGKPLLTTFYTPAVLSALSGVEQVSCVVTDSDINRVWVPPRSTAQRIRYFAPSARAVRRLQSYGVGENQIELTGFPLPGELLGGPELPVARRNLAARLVRLDPSGVFRRRCGEELERDLGPLPAPTTPPRLTYAIGGAGAQAELASIFLPSLAPLLRERRLSLTLVAGARPEVAVLLTAAIAAAGLGPDDVEVLFEPVYDHYFRRFHARLADTDILWTKPSEMTFFGALGLPLLLAPAMGVHEHENGRWARDLGCGLRPHDLSHVGEWLTDWLTDGTLAGAAWSGWQRMPRRGLYRIAAHYV